MPDNKEPISRSERRELNKENQKKERQQEKEQKKKQKEEAKQQKEKQNDENPKKYRRRILPIWLRIIIVLVICAVALLAGLMIGYGIIGDGNPTDALKIDTWQHIIDIVTKTE
ncbi:DNA-directed RNA polymerase subunit beta [Pontibacillus sp. HMF3514]|uniref:DNA-directed RNA polymerase subunit beta n=1 Tax=Pontibacillus sp. HMF3514 TaxID=2692425 RepID=UPI00131FCC58|nr:DNA-directed RNA polymerase subunit beta [Pontibacillus sp. HMF3514]QHE53772.1 DNA-directed RNA polymerase subunit beta [Pontibacillus sp. HMF3514]